jgi:MFS family permease
MGLVFFGVGLLQAGSSIAAGWLAGRIGLLNTMVFTHLPSNVLLALVPLAPTLWLAVLLLLARSVLSQMDVPARQAYVAALVDPGERTAAAAYTNAARHIVRPAGPALASAAMGVGIGLPFVVAGALKIVYDLLVYRTFRRVRLNGRS